MGYATRLEWKRGLGDDAETALFATGVGCWCAYDQIPICLVGCRVFSSGVTETVIRMSETQRRLAIERLTKLAMECRGYFAQGDELKMNLDTHSGEHPTPVMVHGDGVARGKIDAIAAIGAEAIRRLDEPDVPGATPLVQWLTFVLSRTEDAMSGSISIRPSIPRPGDDLDPGVFGFCGGANLFEDSANAIEELLAEQTSRLESEAIDAQSPQGRINKPSDERATSTGSRSNRKAEWLAQAMLLVQGHPDWPDSRVADEVGVHKSTLSRDMMYRTAAALARGDSSNIPKGHWEKDDETGLTDLVAYDEDDRGEDDWD